MPVTRKKQKQLINHPATKKRQLRHKIQNQIIHKPTTGKPEITHKQNTTSARRDFFKSLIGMHINN